MHQGEREEGGDQIIHNDHCRNEITFFVHLFIALPENVAKKNVKTKPSYYVHTWFDNQIQGIKKGTI